VLSNREEDFEVLLQKTGRWEAVLHPREENHRDMLLQALSVRCTGDERSSVILLSQVRDRKFSSGARLFP